MLLHPTHHDMPFPFFLVTHAFSEKDCSTIERTFSLGGDWQNRNAGFYQCELRDVTDDIPAALRSEVVTRMRAITGLPLTDQVAVTAQRMLPGHRIGVHSDRPLLGYEIARLVIQFNKHWQPAHGGILELFAEAEGEALYRVHPVHNEAFGFLLHENSYHGVTEVTQTRQTVVFNFWHIANTPDLAAHVTTLFLNSHFSELPSALNHVASAAESSLPEEKTFHAGTAAVALLRWGYEDATVVAGYKYCAGLPASETPGTETYAAVRLADWVARLYRDSFDLTGWNRLNSELAGMEKFDRLKPTLALCLHSR